MRSQALTLSRVLLASIGMTAASCRSATVAGGGEPFKVECQADPTHAQNVDQFLVIGHRGAPKTAVENTIASMQAAMTEGANAVEIDLSLTKDGQVVLWHDWDPDDTIAIARQSGAEPDVAHRPRVPDVGDSMRRRISSLTLAELRTHYGYSNKDGQPVSAEIPTFDQLAAWAAAERRLRSVVLDLKVPADEAALAPALFDSVVASMTRRAAKFEIQFSTPHQEVWDLLRDRAALADRGLIHEVDPGVVVIDTMSCDSSSSRAARMVERGSASTVLATGVPQEAWDALVSHLECDLDARDRSDAGRGIEKVIAATINPSDQLSCLVDMGLDGIVTDEPAALRAIAVGRGRKIQGQNGAAP